MRILSLNRIGIVTILFLCTSCHLSNRYASVMSNKNFLKGTFAYDLNFMAKRQKVIVLVSQDSLSQVLISPDYQGRVMTSTSNGLNGLSYGWINYNAISSDSVKPHINPYGGEDRFWLGPEGGQFSLYFKKDSVFDFKHWQVPKVIDTEPFDLISNSRSEVSFEKQMQLENYSGSVFQIKVNRNIRLLDKSEARKLLMVDLPDSLEWLGYETENIIANAGDFEWTEQTGMVSVWILGMYVPSPDVTVFIPYRKSQENDTGKILTDDYFGKVPADRLKIDSGFIFFRCDGRYRSKIGISPLHAMPLAASYDAENHILTIVKFSFPSDKLLYVNSLWKIQENPFEGDAINSYNDGPVEDGSQMGPFYEIESSSPAAALKSGESLTHYHRTFHFRGSEDRLDKLVRQIFGIKLEQVKSAFK
jgi:hypothetical protein